MTGGNDDEICCDDWIWLVRTGYGSFRRRNRNRVQGNFWICGSTIIIVINVVDVVVVINCRHMYNNCLFSGGFERLFMRFDSFALTSIAKRRRFHSKRAICKGMCVSLFFICCCILCLLTWFKRFDQIQTEKKNIQMTQIWESILCIRRMLLLSFWFYALSVSAKCPNEWIKFGNLYRSGIGQHGVVERVTTGCRV